MKNLRKTVIFMLLAATVVLCAAIQACQEGERFGISSGDTDPPHAPTVDSIIELPGGARIYYKLPADKDVLSIEASFTATNGEVIKSAVSLLAPPVLEIFGLSDTLEKTLQFYALDRAGNKSTIQQLKVKPKEPTYSRVAKSLNVHAGFGSLLITWKNELALDVNVFVDFTFSDNGVQRSLRQAYSSRDTAERKLIKSDNFSTSQTISVKVSVEDRYGNQSGIIDKGQIALLTDELISKQDWQLPPTGRVIGGVPMADGNSYEGRTAYVIDGNLNDLMHPGNYGHFYNTSQYSPATEPAFHFFIDLGAKYELSRIRTHQRYFYDINQLLTPGTTGYKGIKGDVYASGNIGIYRMYWWDGDDAGTVGEWKFISEVKIPMATEGMNAVEVAKIPLIGDESLMYPESSGWTPATRWFRYTAVHPFENNYKGANSRVQCLAELTLYGRKAQ
ncbi:hypothetical protein FACS1894199_17680 [Bacteroidia bacterium]|nr:hypothetical protein FACS1894199_17680 [Bacteroidia bacterium]